MAPSRAVTWPGPGRRATAVVALALGCGLVAFPASRAVASPGLAPSPVTTPTTAPAPAAIAKGRDSLQLLSQDAWVGPAQAEFRLRLQVSASDETDESLGVVVYSALSARSEFQAALAGDVSDIYEPLSPVPLRDLHADPAGGVDVDVPVNQAGLNAEFSTGVYPVQVFLEKGGFRVGQPVTTFLVYAGADVSRQRLDAALVVPLAAKVPISARTGAPGPVPAAARSWLEADSGDLARYHVPVTVQADLPTIEALANAGPLGSAAVAQVKSAVIAGDELLPSSSLPIDIASLVSSGLGGDARALLSTGSSVLGSIVGTQPNFTTWGFGDGIDPASVAALADMGAKQLVLPEDDLSALPPESPELTFAQPTGLKAFGSATEVIGADSELAARVEQASAPGEAVLVADQVLAELAMIDLERPSVVRGVVLLPARGTAIDPTFLSVFLAGLEGNPLVQASTVAGEFSSVPPYLAGNKPFSRYILAPRSAPLLAGTGQLSLAFGALSADEEVFGNSPALIVDLGQQAMLSLSAVWSSSERESMIGAIVSAARSELAKVRLPPPISITLTSHQGQLPLTVLSSAGMPAHVRLLLSSEELSFVAQRFPEGDCVPVNPGSETCDLTLAKTTTLQVPVTVRTSGVFQLSLALETPSSDTSIATSTETVRSTATNEVALGLMAGAAFFLAVWWARNARHGRRARKLVPRPTYDEADEDVPAGEQALPGGAGGVAAPASRSHPGGPASTGASLPGAAGAPPG